MAKSFYATTLSFNVPKVSVKEQDKKARAAAAKAIQQGLLQGSAEVESGLKTALNEALQSSIWSWPRTTLRKNGQTAGTSRDIIDTGQLRGSLSIKTSFLQTKVNTKITYSAPYAALVHYGGMVQPYGNRNAASVLIPARPWVDAVLKGEGSIPVYNYREVYSSAIEKVWKSE